jgi:hypothetical protein
VPKFANNNPPHQPIIAVPLLIKKIADVPYEFLAKLIELALSVVRP